MTDGCDVSSAVLGTVWSLWSPVHQMSEHLWFTEASVSVHFTAKLGSCTYVALKWEENTHTHIKVYRLPSFYQILDGHAFVLNHYSHHGSVASAKHIICIAGKFCMYPIPNAVWQPKKEKKNRKGGGVGGVLHNLLGNILPTIRW